MKNSINLHFNSVNRGPGKVVENLALGLNKLGISIYANDLPREESYQCCLQPTNMLNNLPRQTMMGPNLFVLPSEWGNFCKRFDHYVVPSAWVKSKYEEFDCLNHATIDVWPVGIDTDVWNKNKRKTNKILVYVKNRPKDTVDSVLRTLEDSKIDFIVLQYGNYSENELYSACLESDACILVTGTESQGIAYMQILSMGLPCFVLNKTTWNNEGNYKDVQATSVPYFDEFCGIITDVIDTQSLTSFLQKIDSYDPRNFIIKNHNLEKSANDLVDLLKRYEQL